MLGRARKLCTLVARRPRHRSPPNQVPYCFRPYLYTSTQKEATETVHISFSYRRTDSFILLVDASHFLPPASFGVRGETHCVLLVLRSPLSEKQDTRHLYKTELETHHIAQRPLRKRCFCYLAGDGPSTLVFRDATHTGRELEQNCLVASFVRIATHPPSRQTPERAR